MKAIGYTLICLFIVSCGTMVDYDYETGTNFSEYKTFNYFSDMKTGFSPLDEKRLIRAIDAKLLAMGFSKSDMPNFRIDIQSRQIEQNQNSNVGVGIGGTGRNVGGGVSIGIPVRGTRTTTEVSIEFVDDAKNGVFWQAIATLSNIGATPERREASFQKLTDKVFSAYPPKATN